MAGWGFQDLDCFVASAPRNDGDRFPPDLSTSWRAAQIDCNFVDISPQHLHVAFCFSQPDVQYLLKRLKVVSGDGNRAAGYGIAVSGAVASVPSAFGRSGADRASVFRRPDRRHRDDPLREVVEAEGE